MTLSTTYTGPFGRYPTGYASQQVRRSLPNMAHSMLINEPAKIYPYHLLIVTNFRLPSDVDRMNLEVIIIIIIKSVYLFTVNFQRHLSDQEFEALLQLPRSDFYRLPQWKRNDMKRRVRLF